MGLLADKVRSDLHKEFFKKHKILFLANTREYCRECKKYVEENCRERLIQYRKELKQEEYPGDFL